MAGPVLLSPLIAMLVSTIQPLYNHNVFSSVAELVKSQHREAGTRLPCKSEFVNADVGWCLPSQV